MGKEKVDVKKDLLKDAKMKDVKDLLLNIMGMGQTNENVTKIVDEYHKLSTIFNKKKPSPIAFKRYKLEPKKVNSSPYIYKYKNLEILHYHNTMLSKDTYPFSIDDVLSILEYYGLIDVLETISIIHYPQTGAQGFVSKNDKAEEIGGSDGKTWNRSMTLFIPVNDKWLETRFKGIDINDKIMVTLCVLLHEMSHALGNISNGDTKICEDEADRFAVQEYPKWIEFLKY